MGRSAVLLDLAAELQLRRGRATQAPARAEWTLSGLAGRLVELAGDGDSAVLTLASGLVLEAQRAGEPAAWVMAGDSAFYPPDLVAGGIDLGALAVVRAPDPKQLARAADHLTRSGALGLLVLDLGAGASVSMGVLSRLLGLAQHHDTALVFLTTKRRADPSLGSLISLRAQTRMCRTGVDRFACGLHVLKDKRGAPGWEHEEICRGPAGLH